MEDRWPARLAVRLNDGGAGGYCVIDASARDLTTERALGRIESHVALHRPHLVTLQFIAARGSAPGAGSVNPVDRFEAELRAIAQGIRERTGAMVVLMVAAAAPQDASGADDHARACQAVTRKVAYELNAPLLELPGPPEELDAFRDPAVSIPRLSLATIADARAMVAADFLKRLL